MGMCEVVMQFFQKTTIRGGKLTDNTKTGKSINSKIRLFSTNTERNSKELEMTASKDSEGGRERLLFFIKSSVELLVWHI